MPPSTRTGTPAHTSETPSANPQRPADPHEYAPDGGHGPESAKDDSQTAKQDDGSGLYVVVAQDGAMVELHSEASAEARVSQLTWGSRQHRKEAEEADTDIPEGGGSHELNRKDIKVYKLTTTEVTDF
jgi:hypothetical protein